MLKATLSRANASQMGEGAVFHHPILSPEQVGADLEHGWAFLERGQAACPHCCARAKLWVVYDGQGRVHVARASAPIKELDTILIPPNVEHRVENTGQRDLIIFWAAWKPVAAVEIGDRVAVAPFERARLKPAHLGTFYHFEPFSTKVMGAPERFTTGWGLVGGGVASEPHKHPTAELYVFLRGTAVQQVGLECAAVSATDSVMVPADTLHNLLNYAEQELLLYWIEVIPGSLPK